MKKTDLILHPIRLQILSTLSANHLSTQEIAERLFNIPLSTIYRHMRVLLDNDLIQVVETRQIKGTEEKIYQLSISPQLDETDMRNVSKEQHIQYFLAYILSVLNGFSRYIHQPGERDLLADFVGYSDLYLYMNQEELRSFGSALKKLVHPFTENQPGDGRHLHKVSIISHPETMENPND